MVRCDRRVVISYVTTEDTCKSNFNQIYTAGENCAVRKIVRGISALAKSPKNNLIALILLFLIEEATADFSWPRRFKILAAIS